MACCGCGDRRVLPDMEIFSGALRASGMQGTKGWGMDAGKITAGHAQIRERPVSGNRKRFGWYTGMHGFGATELSSKCARREKVLHHGHARLGGQSGDTQGNVSCRARGCQACWGGTGLVKGQNGSRGGGNRKSLLPGTQQQGKMEKGSRHG